MTKKDYIAIGWGIQEVAYGGRYVNGAFNETLEEVISMLCRVFKQDNPEFNTNHFRDFVHGECGPNGGKLT